MKKVTKVSTIAMLVMAMFLTIIGTAAAKERQVTVLLNGQPFVAEDMPIMVNGRTLVPMRAIFEALGAELAWDGKLQQVTAEKGEKLIKLVIGKKNVSVNGATKAIDVAPQLFNGRTYVPLRFVSETLGANVGWDAITYTVTISQGLPKLGEVPPPQDTAFAKEVVTDFLVRYLYANLNEADYQKLLEQYGYQLVVDQPDYNVYAKPGRLVQVSYNSADETYAVSGINHAYFGDSFFFPLLVGIPAPMDKTYTNEAIVKVNGVYTAQYTYDNLDLDAYVQGLVFAGYIETKATNGDAEAKAYTLNDVFTIYVKSVGSKTVIYAEI